MPANNTSGLVHWLAGKAPESIGLLYTPARKERPVSWLPYALDNGAYSATMNGIPFNWPAWTAAVEFFAHHPQAPLWVVVPDVPFDAIRTIDKWELRAPEYRALHLRLALAVQDGMTPETVRGLTVEPDVIFVGGSTEWKWTTVKMWCSEFKHVHVARVNGRRGLDICAEAGADSCDGSGWFRGDLKQLLELTAWVADRYSLDRSECAEAAKSSRYLRSQQGVIPGLMP